MPGAPTRLKVEFAASMGLWTAAHLLLVWVIAWVAFHLQLEEIAPAVAFPIAVGALVGLGGSLISRNSMMLSIRAALVAAAAWGLLAVVAQDYIGHRFHARLYEAEMSRQPALSAVLADRQDLGPSFMEYLTGVVNRRVVWWVLDLGLTSAAALAVTAIASKRSADSLTSKSHQ